MFIVYFSTSDLIQAHLGMLLKSRQNGPYINGMQVHYMQCLHYKPIENCISVQRFCTKINVLSVCLSSEKTFLWHYCNFCGKSEEKSLKTITNKIHKYINVAASFACHLVLICIEQLLCKHQNFISMWWSSSRFMIEKKRFLCRFAIVEMFQPFIDIFYTLPMFCI